MSPQRSIGRSRELAQLEQAVADAKQGRGGLWLIAGEPGIGKTRLAEDSAAWARAAGFSCAWGRCWESGGAPAFWPWIQVARTLGNDVTAPPAALRAAALSELPPVAAEGLSRFELFDAVAAWLMALAESRPLWIALEDLHAADAESLALLESLAISLRSTRVLVIGTLRDAALESGAVSEPCRRIARQAGVLTLARLQLEMARELLVSNFETNDEGFICRALEATEGHPLFLVELVRLARLRGSDLSLDELVPASLYSVFKQRLERLSPRGLDVLVHAALVSIDLDHDLLSYLFDRQSLNDAIDEALQHGLIRQLGRKSWRFCHAVLREVLSEALEAEAQEHAHCQIAEALTKRGAAASAVAHHLYRAGADRRQAACDVSVQAARESLARFAFEDALGHVSRASSFLRDDPDLLLRARAQVIEGHALLGLGRVDEGLAACLVAADLARQCGSAQVLADAALAYGSVFRFAVIDPKLVALLEEAIELLGHGDSALTAQVLARLAAARQPDSEPSRPIALARDALAMAERVGDTEALVASLRSGCSALVDLAHPSERQPLDQRHLELAMRLGLGTDELRARQRLLFDCVELGDVRMARAHLDQARRLADSGVHPRYRWLAPALLALNKLWAGELEATRDLIDEASALGARAGDDNARLAYLFQTARLIELSGEDQDVARVARGLGEAMGNSVPGGHLSALSRARFLLEVGRTDEGLAAVDRTAVDAVLAIGDRTMLYGAARWAAAVGAADVGRTLLDRFGDQRELFVTDGVLGLCWRAPLSLVLAYAEEAVKDLTAGVSSAVAAARLAQRAGGLPVAAECFGLAARLLLQLGRRDDAEAHLARAMEAIEGLKLAGLERRLRAQLVPAERRTPLPSATRSAFRDADTADAPPEFSQEGDVVCIHWKGGTVRVKATKGIAVLSRLVTRPGVAVHVLDLVHAEQDHPPIDRGDAGELLDAEARSTYRNRARQLQQELLEAERHNDLGRTEALRTELEFIASELTRGSSLGGRGRRAPAAEERARQAIRKQIQASLKHLEKLHPELARYLSRSVRTGRSCVFEP